MTFRRRAAAVMAGINNQVFAERYRVSRVNLDQYGNSISSIEPFEVDAVPLDKEFSQKLDGERLGADFAGRLSLTVPVLRFRRTDLPYGFSFTKSDRIEQLDYEQRAYVVEEELPSHDGLIQVRVSVA